MGFRPWGIVRKAVVWIPAGFLDRIRSRYGHEEIQVGKLIAQKFDQCSPWIDHLEPTTISSINDAVKQNDFSSARGLVAFGARAAANRECIEMLEFAIDLLADGKEIITELYFLE